MDKSMCAIERGFITGIEDSGYIIASLDRDGIITPPIKPIEAGKPGIQEPDYNIGNMVIYFIFKDGTGKILCAI